MTGAYPPKLKMGVAGNAGARLAYQAGTEGRQSSRLRRLPSQGHLLLFGSYRPCSLARVWSRNAEVNLTGRPWHHVQDLDRLRLKRIRHWNCQTNLALSADARLGMPPTADPIQAATLTWLSLINRGGGSACCECSQCAGRGGPSRYSDRRIRSLPRGRFLMGLTEFYSRCWREITGCAPSERGAQCA